MRFTKQKIGYQSEITQFLDELKKADPQLEQKQRDGRAIFWDKPPLSLDEQQRILASTVPVDAH